jgi:hypothetical protein
VSTSQAVALFAGTRRRRVRNPRRTRPRDVHALVPRGLGGAIGSLGLLAVEVVGSLTMWTAIPLGWIWAAGAVYQATDSLAVGGLAALLGLAVSEVLMAKGLARVDAGWVALRRRSGHVQKDGALTRIVVATAALGLLAFLLWYYVLSHAFVLPFMPSS